MIAAELKADSYADFARLVAHHVPGEDNAAYWKRFDRLTRERIEELEREEQGRKQRIKEKRSPGAPLRAVGR